MKTKINKYIWLTFNLAMIIFHLILLFNAIGFGYSASSMIGYAMISLFVTAIVYELKLNEIIFYIMLIITLILFVYSYFFCPFFKQ